MKKVFIACFLALIMLMIPVTTAVRTAEISNNINVSSVDVDLPQFYVTEGEYAGINSYIELNFAGEEKEDAYGIRDSIISPDDLEVNIIGLADAFISYSGIEPIPEDELDINKIDSIEELNQLIEEYWGVVDGELLEGFFKELLDRIIELVKDRLGWIYEFVERIYDLFENSVSLVYDFIQPAIVAVAVIVVSVVNQILSVPELFKELITDLFNLDFEDFVGTLITFVEDFGTNVSALVQMVIDIVNNQQLKDYLTLFQEYIDWLTSKPWEASIQVTGQVRYNLGYLAGGTVTCRGQSSTTDSDGRYKFSVDSTPAEDSFPANESYGMHKCVITVSKDGKVLKETPGILSYCFSGGKIGWPFVIIKGKSKDTSLRTILLEKLNNILERIHMLLPNFLRIINRIDIYSI